MKKPLLLGLSGAVLAVMLIMGGCPTEADDKPPEATFGNTLELSGQVKSVSGSDYAPGGEKTVQVLCGGQGVSATKAKIDQSGKLSVVVNVPPEETLKSISVLTSAVAVNYPGAAANPTNANVAVLSMTIDAISALKKTKVSPTTQTVDYWYADKAVTITGTHTSTKKELKMELKEGWNAICTTLDIANGTTELALSNPDGLNWTKTP